MCFVEGMMEIMGGVGWNYIVLSFCVQVQVVSQLIQRILRYDEVCVVVEVFGCCDSDCSIFKNIVYFVGLIDLVD